ncbi:MAG: Gfo/Idh/MocA family oxidoreductase [Victivallales bacterium]|nr:Gfo/Idh/MocA family oxidoreductase [Victivallales bacterium]
MKKYKVGFVGAGERSVCYAKAYASCPEIEIAAVADINPHHRRAMAVQSGLTTAFAEHDDWRELLRYDLDGVVITTPNHLHREMAIPFIEKGVTVALEKPMTTTMGDSEAILDAARQHQVRLLIGFVLRSTPFYRKIHELISSGAIGRVVAVETNELAGRGESSTISRRPWRRYERFSGGSLMEKSCHDMDLLNWLTGSRPVAVNSFGGSLVFNPNPLLPDHCADCDRKDCAYRPDGEELDAAGNLRPGCYESDAHCCIYNVDKDVVDNQNLNIQYANGTVATFLMSFNCAGPMATRNFHAIGQKGRVWGNFEAHEVFHYDNLSGKLSRFDTAGDGTGHGGGDANHARELLHMMQDPAYLPAQDAYSGYLGNAICLAADMSRREQRQVKFRYDARGVVSFD